MALDTKITVSLDDHEWISNPALRKSIQRVHLVDAFRKVLMEPYDEPLPLEGRVFRVTLHDDGVHITAELLPKA